MQKQNFENKVQQKMEELSFVPSEPVWHKIEEGIRKKKERRRIIFWIIFPLMLLSGGSYLYLSNTKQDQNLSANTNVVKDHKEPKRQEEKIGETIGKETKTSPTLTFKEDELNN